MNKISHTPFFAFTCLLVLFCSPLYPQIELLQYCREEGILLQAYASLGGQDTGKKAWSQLLGTANDGKTLDLLGSEPVQKLAAQMTVDGGGDGAQAVAIITPALVLLRWALEQGVALIPKTVTEARLVENAGVFDCSTMSQRQVDGLRDELLAMVRANNHPDHRPASSNNANDNNELTRLCWRSDPLRHLNFD